MCQITVDDKIAPEGWSTLVLNHVDKISPMEKVVHVDIDWNICPNCIYSIHEAFDPLVEVLG